MDDIMKVTIIVLTYNRKEILDDLLRSISQISYTPLEVIIVDNHSEDGTEDLLLNVYPQFKYIRTDKNIGVGARNLGMKIAKGDILICLDDDVFGIDDVSIGSIINLFSNNNQLGAVNFRITHYDSGKLCNWVHHCAHEEFSLKIFPTYEITEGAVAFKRCALEKSGYYPENFFMSHEGPDLAFRLIDNGFQVVYSGDIFVRHRFSETGRASWYNYYYDTRNHFWLAVRNFPVNYMIRYLTRNLTSTFIYSVRDGFIRYWLRAIFDGISGLPSMKSERKVLSNASMDIIKQIDRGRPPLFYLIKKRLFSKGIRLLDSDQP